MWRDERAGTEVAAVMEICKANSIRLLRRSETNQTNPNKQKPEEPGSMTHG